MRRARRVARISPAVDVCSHPRFSQALIGHHGGVPALVRLLSHGSEKGMGREVAREAAGALSVLATNSPENREMISRAEGVR
jgi:hypothetical protein